MVLRKSCHCHIVTDGMVLLNNILVVTCFLILEIKVLIIIIVKYVGIRYSTLYLGS